MTIPLLPSSQWGLHIVSTAFYVNHTFLLYSSEGESHQHQTLAAVLTLHLLTTNQQQNMIYMLLSSPLPKNVKQKMGVFAKIFCIFPSFFF